MLYRGKLGMFRRTRLVGLVVLLSLGRPRSARADTQPEAISLTCRAPDSGASKAEPVKRALEAPLEKGQLILDSVITSAPQIVNDPRQLRILFSPVPSRYVPLTQ